MKQHKKKPNIDTLTKRHVRRNGTEIGVFDRAKDGKSA